MLCYRVKDSIISGLTLTAQYCLIFLLTEDGYNYENQHSK